MSDEKTKRDTEKAAKASEKASATAARHKTLQDRQAATSQADKSASKTERDSLKQEARNLHMDKIPASISTKNLREIVGERREEVRQQNAAKDKANSELTDLIKSTLADLSKGSSPMSQADRDFAMVQNKSFDPPAAPPTNYRPDRGNTNNFIPITFYVYNNETGKVGTMVLTAVNGFAPLAPL
jgi:hypothetical protein